MEIPFLGIHYRINKEVIINKMIAYIPRVEELLNTIITTYIKRKLKEWDNDIF